MGLNDSDTNGLVSQAADGDSAAMHELMDRHRDRLRKMVAVRVDQRIKPRIDPSDIVQEALAEAAAGIVGYARERPVFFYPWLRRIAWQRLVKAHRRHIEAQRRTVVREQELDLALLLGHEHHYQRRT